VTDALLTLDLGNSRAKLRLYVRAELGRPLECVAAETLELGPRLGDSIDAWLASRPRVGLALVCAVCDPVVERGVLERLNARVAAVCADLDADLQLELRSRETVGRDRLFAARGALERTRASCLVVDAGTALTVDAVRLTAVETEDESSLDDGPSLRSRAAFLGGAIAPGPSLLTLALERGGARLPRVEARPDAPALGRDTASALAAGVVHGFRGATLELIRAVGLASGLERAPVVCTGGALAYLQPVVRSLGARSRVEEDLVHLGLLAAWRARTPARIPRHGESGARP
jgi:pantothenate kinase type III